MPVKERIQISHTIWQQRQHAGQQGRINRALTSLQVAREMKMGIPMMPKTAINFRAISLTAARTEPSTVLDQHMDMHPCPSSHPTQLLQLAVRYLGCTSLMVLVYSDQICLGMRRKGRQQANAMQTARWGTTPLCWM